MRWARHVARRGEERCILDFDWETCERENTWKTQVEMGG
jgi:hypothetical protein